MRRVPVAVPLRDGDMHGRGAGGAAALPRKQERGGSRSRSGGRLLLVEGVAQTVVSSGAVKSEWRLPTATHNLKLHRHQLAAA
jgi:hypothetical protein